MNDLTNHIEQSNTTLPPRYDSLNDVRAFLGEHGSSSHTSLRYQADTFEIVVNCLGAGDCVIEVGTFKGGLSCQLAFLLEHTGKTLILIDIVEEYIQWVKHLIKELGITTNILYWTGTLEQFAATYPNTLPSVIIIDGNHKYAAVSQDIYTIKTMKHQPAAVIFHDLSLRYGRSQDALHVRIDQAIATQYLQYGYQYREIGAFPKESQDQLLRVLSLSAQQGNYHFHDTQCREGIMIVTNENVFRHCCPFLWKNLQRWSQYHAFSTFTKVIYAWLHVWDVWKNQNTWLHTLKAKSSKYFLI